MGLLDNFSEFAKTPEGQGLLAATFGGLAGAQRGAPLNSIGRAGLAGIAGYGNAIERQDQLAQREEVKKFRDMQMAQFQAQIDAQKKAQAAAEAKQAALPRLWQAEQTPGSFTLDPITSQPTITKASTVGAPKLDWQSALAAGYTPQEIEALSKMQDLGQTEVKDWKEVEGPNGTKLLQGYDKFGRPVGSGAAGYVAPVQVSQGDKVSFVKPTAGVTLPIGMSPSEKDASARGWATVKQGEKRLGMEEKKFATETANGGYSSKPLPPSALKMQSDAVDALNTAAGIRTEINKLSNQIKDGKLSFGPVNNLLNQARNASGLSNEESRNFASFKSTLEKMRNDSLRLNSGVQTDGDAQRAWNELFQNITDTALVQQRLVEIDAINKRAEELQKLKIDQVRGNYNAPPLELTKPVLNVPEKTQGKTLRFDAQGNLLP